LSLGTKRSGLVSLDSGWGVVSDDGVCDTKVIRFCLTEIDFGGTTFLVSALVKGELTLTFFGSDYMPFESDRLPLLYALYFGAGVLGAACPKVPPIA